MMAETAKPVPVPNSDSAPFWQACGRRVLTYQRCEACGAVQVPPRRHCAACRASALAWQESAGRGTVESYTVVHRAPTEAFRADTPYVIALVRFDEGFQLMMNVLDATEGDLSIGLPVRVTFEERGGRLLPQAVPA
jgi:uncharacterized OB-fold protein